MAHLWYSIQTYAGSERSVKAAIENIIAENRLEEVITEVIVPTEDVIEVKNGKKKICKNQTKHLSRQGVPDCIGASQPRVDFIKARSWVQKHFALYAILLRSFLRCKSKGPSVRAWRRA